MEPLGLAIINPALKQPTHRRVRVTCLGFFSPSFARQREKKKFLRPRRWRLFLPPHTERSENISTTSPGYHHLHTTVLLQFARACTYTTHTHTHPRCFPDSILSVIVSSNPSYGNADLREVYKPAVWSHDREYSFPWLRSFSCRLQFFFAYVQFSVVSWLVSWWIRKGTWVGFPEVIHLLSSGKHTYHKQVSSTHTWMMASEEAIIKSTHSAYASRNKCAFVVDITKESYYDIIQPLNYPYLLVI